jgi:hypothetical protein
VVPTVFLGQIPDLLEQMNEERDNHVGSNQEREGQEQRLPWTNPKMEDKWHPERTILWCVPTEHHPCVLIDDAGTGERKS